MKHVPGLLLVKPPEGLSREPTKQCSESLMLLLQQKTHAFAFDLMVLPRFCQGDAHFSQLIHLRLASRYLSSVSHGQWSRDGYQLLTSRQEYNNF